VRTEYPARHKAGVDQAQPSQRRYAEQEAKSYQYGLVTLQYKNATGDQEKAYFKA
jgi:hypothetical protein